MLSCKIPKTAVIDSHLLHHYHSAIICELNNMKGEDSVIQTCGQVLGGLWKPGLSCLGSGHFF